MLKSWSVTRSWFGAYGAVAPLNGELFYVLKGFSYGFGSTAYVFPFWTRTYLRSAF